MRWFRDGLRRFRRKESVERYQNELLRAHYKEVENMYQEMREWRHNYRNHIQILKSYASEGDIESIRGYLAQLDEVLESIAPSIRTGNRMMDAIVNSKVSIAKAENICVECSANLTVALTTPEVDLCTIIGNLFDNAIEACRELPPEERLIRVYMDMKGSQFYISFTNTTSKKKQKKVGRGYLSTKKGGGIGLASIDKLIDLHRGYLSRNSEDGAFSTEILLPQ